MGLGRFVVDREYNTQARAGLVDFIRADKRALWDRWMDSPIEDKAQDALNAIWLGAPLAKGGSMARGALELSDVAGAGRRYGQGWDWGLPEARAPLALDDVPPSNRIDFVPNKPVLRSPSELMGVEPASQELLTAVGSKRSLLIAQPGSEELRMLDYFGAEASVSGVNNSSILLRQNPSKAAVLEEFLHGTQSRLGVVDRLGTSGYGSAETHVKDFMIRHQGMLGLSDEDVRILQVLKDKGL